MEGWLEVKRGGLQGLFGPAWVRRYCKCDGKTLSICSDENTPPKAKHVLAVSGCTLMDKGAASDEYHPEFHFAIAAAPRRLYRFRALQEEDKVQWLTVLLEAKLTAVQGRQAADSGACSIQ